MEQNLIDRSSVGQKGLTLALSITFLMMVAEVAGGIISNSLALLSDAGHMLTDILALSFSLLALKFGAISGIIISLNLLTILSTIS